MLAETFPGAGKKRVYIDQINSFSSEEISRRSNKIGEWTDNFWGYKTDGFFQSEDEIRKLGRY